MPPAQPLSVHRLLVLCQALAPGKRYFVPLAPWPFQTPSFTCGYLHVLLASCSLFSTRYGSVLYTSTLQIETGSGFLLAGWTDKGFSLHFLQGGNASFLFPRPLNVGLVLLWNSIIPTVHKTVYRIARTHTTATTTTTEFPKVLHADPHPSPVPDSGNLRPVHFKTLRRSLLQIVPVTAGRDSTSLLEHTVLPSPPRLHRRSQKPPLRRTRSRYRHDTSQITATTPRGRIIIVIPRVQKHLKTH